MENVRSELELALKHLEKQKIFHKRYVEEVDSSEAIRIKEFENQRRSLEKENKELKRANKQLLKDNDYLQILINSMELNEENAKKPKLAPHELRVMFQSNIFIVEIKPFRRWSFNSNHIDMVAGLGGQNLEQTWHFVA